MSPSPPWRTQSGVWNASSAARCSTENPRSHSRRWATRCGLICTILLRPQTLHMRQPGRPITARHTIIESLQKSWPMTESSKTRSGFDFILKRAPIGSNRENHDVLQDGVIVGRVFLSPAAPEHRRWMWASGHNGGLRRAAHGYEPTREAAMVVFKKSFNPWTSGHCPMCCPTCPNSADAALRQGRGLPVGARRSRAEHAVGCMEDLSPGAPRGTGTAFTGTENGPPRPSRSGGGCAPLSGPLFKRVAAHEREANVRYRPGRLIAWLHGRAGLVDQSRREPRCLRLARRSWRLSSIVRCSDK